MSTANVQPGMGNENGPSLPSPNRLSTLRHDIWPDVEMASIVRRRIFSCPNGTTNWYCRKPRGP